MGLTNCALIQYYFYFEVAVRGSLDYENIMNWLSYILGDFNGGVANEL